MESTNPTENSVTGYTGEEKENSNKNETESGPLVFFARLTLSWNAANKKKSPNNKQKCVKGL